MRQISAETVEWFRGACNGGDLSRTGLTHELCVRENWFGRLGGLRLASERKLLPRLAEELEARLPEAEAMEFAPHARPARDFADSSVCGSLRDLGALSLDLVAAPEERCRWAAMTETHHPEGWRRPPGAQVRYWVCSQRYGVLGGIGFTAAGIQLGPRDAEIGWSGDARVANIGKILCNHRFLLLPGVRVKGLASRVLRLATGRIGEDWAATYGERPVLGQSFTGPGQSGLSYRAAGWKRCPKRTSGRRSGVRRAGRLMPLVVGWQRVLCSAPARVLGWSGSIYGSGGWAAREYGRSTHPDGRVRRRTAQMGTAWVHRLGEHLPSIFPGRAEQTAAYRLLSNYAVTMDHILDSHFEQTVERCRAERLVLAVQDTTTLNYDGLSSTSGLDELGGGGKGSAGILAHFAGDARSNGGTTARWSPPR